jgi:hypothetical protein
MNLSFRTKWLKGGSTYFIEKIWSGLDIMPTHKNLHANGIPISYMRIYAPNCLPFVVNSEYKPKLHTIRRDKKGRWKSGMKIHFYINSRTKNMFRFAPIIPVASIQKIKIECPTEYLNDQKIYIDGKLLTTEEMQQLAWNDGFENLAAFQLWFNTDFEGIIIHWTNLKYKNYANKRKTSTRT